MTKTCREEDRYFEAYYFFAFILHWSDTYLLCVLHAELTLPWLGSQWWARI